jgi:hypothetical protein
VVGSLLRHVGEWLTSRNMTLGTTRKIWLVAFARNISWNDEFTMPPVMGGVLARSISWLISSFLRHVLVSIALATRSCLFPCSCSRSCSLSCHCGHVRCASAVTTDRDHGVGSSQMPPVRRMKRGMLYAICCFTLNANARLDAQDIFGARSDSCDSSQPCSCTQSCCYPLMLVFLALLTFPACF